MAKISVIVPVYNVEAYLARCLDSILIQSYTDFELIIINDCSPDSCQKIIDEYKARDYRIRSFINDSNLGLGLTRERGIRASTGEYIVFIDSDDYIAYDYLEKYYKAISANKDIDVVIGGYIRDKEGKMSEHLPLDSVWSTITYPMACAKMFRKEFIVDNKIELSDIRMGEDIFFSLSAFYCGMRYKIIQYAGYYYYYNAKSILGKLKSDNQHEIFIIEIFERFYNKYDISRLDDDRYQVLEYTYLANVINSLIVYGHGRGYKRMSEKRKLIIEDLYKRFPNYTRNKYIGFLKPKGQTFKIRIGVGTVMLLKKIRLDGLFFLILSFV